LAICWFKLLIIIINITNSDNVYKLLYFISNYGFVKSMQKK